MSLVMLHVAFALLLNCVQSTVVVNDLFSDGLVLQTSSRDGCRSFMYGTAAINESIKIEGNIQGSPYTGIARAPDGSWKIEINPSSSFNTNQSVSIIGESNSISINDIKMGDVFLCIGDENMLYPMSDIMNATQEIAKSKYYPSIRIATIPSINSDTPQNTFSTSNITQWQQANVDTLPSFSAICYLSAQKLLDMYGGERAMGLIQVAVAKSSLNCWMSADAIKQAMKHCDNIASSSSDTGAVCNDSTLYNGMIHPLIQQTYRSGIYYGASNIDENTATGYGCKWATMVNDYRDRFGAGDYPFAYVEASSMRMKGDAVGSLRMQQMLDIPMMNGSIDTTAMVVSYDLGNASSNIASNQVQIAERIALKLSRIAPVLLYDHNESIYSGPIIDNAVYDFESGVITLSFLNLDENMLQLRSSMDCSECCDAKDIFEVSSDGVKWSNITSMNVDTNDNTLNINIEYINIEYIRYALCNFVECGVFRNGSNIPSEPFQLKVNQEISKRRSINIAQFKQGGRVGATPPMGFNHWNFAHCNIDERLVKQTAQFMIESGLRDVGYEYFNLDDCWQTDRDYESQEIIADSVRFPSGMKSLSIWLKSRGFKFGIYTSATSRTCQLRYGSYLHEYIDAATYCEWGIQYIKVDKCAGDAYQYANESWIKFRNGIDECYNSTGNDMILSVEYCHTVTNCGEWIANLANLWRTTRDIEDYWESMISNADANQALYPIAGPRHWNDPDMLIIGNSGLSIDEEKVQFSLWAIMASPLLIATSLMNINGDSLEILLNKDVIHVNQDILGIQGHKLYVNTSGTEIWYKALLDNNVALVLLNRMETEKADIKVTFSDIGISAKTKNVHIVDLWKHISLANVTSGSYTAYNIAPHSCGMFRLIPLD